MDKYNLKLDDVRSFVGAKNFDESRDFYVAFGWKVTYDAEDLRVMEMEDHGFYLQNYYNKTWCENTMLHISVENVDDWYAFARSKFDEHKFGGGARLGDGPKDAGYARVFHIWDPSGALLHIAQFAESPAQP